MPDTLTIHPEKTLSLGFIGVGWIGRNRMEVLLKNTSAKAVAITEPIPANANAALEAAPGASLIPDVDTLCTHKELDGIVIATPSALHARQSINALQSGKAVFCQKPLGRNSKEVAEVVAASQTANKLLAVDLSYRYTKAFKAIYDLIQNGEIGEVYAVDLVFHNAYGPDQDWFYDLKQSGGGCVMDLGIHLVDLALWTLDFPEIRDVKSHLFAQGKKLTPGEEQVEDFASVSMESATGTLINLECSWHVSAGKDAVIAARFYGTQGGAAFTNINGSFYDFKAEKFQGTKTKTLVTPPDDWSGRAGTLWAESLLAGAGYNALTAQEFIQTATIIDRIYEK